MSFIVNDAVWMSARLHQGQTDVVFLFQNGMSEVLENLLEYCVLLWVDDVFHYASYFNDLLTNLRTLFSRVKSNNVLLLSPTSVTWCGRKIDSQGVQFDDTLVQDLIELECPVNAQNLQQFS
jgi:hypothetical protein